VVGKVSALHTLPVQDLLVVTTTAGAEVLIPFVEQIVPEVNVGEKYVLVTPPAGLFEVNTDESPEEQAAEEQAAEEHAADKNAPAAASEDAGARNPEGQGNA
jgi:16S rRNA processing protein RimM